jgi:3-oxoacyl-[acyl-carrier protein] reductase
MVMGEGKRRNILVVGGSSGIGLELAGRLKAAGDTVTVWSRTCPPELESLGIDHHKVDVTQPLKDQDTEVPSPLHGLAYCPGSITLVPFIRLKEAQFHTDFEINLLGAVRVLQVCLPSFAPEGGGVVFFSTVAAHVGLAYHASIAAAKSAVEGLARSLAAEYAPKFIRFNVVAPSLTDTPLAGKLLSTEEKREQGAKRHPIGRVGSPEDIAGAAAFLLSPESGWITGQVVPVDGGLSSVRIFGT